MKLNWKNLLISIIISLITSSIVFFYLESNTRQLPAPRSFEMAGLVEGIYMPYEQIYMISFVCSVVLTVIFYFVIGHLKKRKK